MATLYRIHPGIGIARVGNSSTGFFVGPEVLGKRGFELEDDGTEGAPVTTYKDASGRIRRQAARFSVWQYDRDDATGIETLIGEVTPAQAVIEWGVELANTKAAGVGIFSFGPPVPRNPGVAPTTLSITPAFPSVAGVNQRASAIRAGEFRGEEVELGELRTDAAGRLLVLGGNGRSFSPSNRPITNFANNADWCDDVSDGPVDAVLRFPDGSSRPVEKGAWVVVAPPDYAPAALGITTLYDIALDAAVRRGWREVPAQPSFRDDVRPMLERTASLRFVNKFAQWNSFSRDYATLGTSGTPAADGLRASVHEQMLDVEQSGILDRFQFTDVQKRILAAWAGGAFQQDGDVPAPSPRREPAAIDRAALECTVGGGFFPGIEIGIVTTNAALYDEPFRFTRDTFVDVDSSVKANGSFRLRAGALTERMACPWQADFLKCSGNWWPAQRPDTVMTAASDPMPHADWDSAITSHADLVSNFWRLGFVRAATAPSGDAVLVESERDPTLPGR